MNPYYAMIHNEYAQENPRINQQFRQKITFPRSANPKEISQQCTTATHTEAAHCQRVLLGFPSLSLTTKGSWIHLWGRVTKPLVSPLMLVPPGTWTVNINSHTRNRTYLPVSSNSNSGSCKLRLEFSSVSILYGNSVSGYL